jgi:hypothetical protein
MTDSSCKGRSALIAEELPEILPKAIQIKAVEGNKSALSGA